MKNNLKNKVFFLPLLFQFFVSAFYPATVENSQPSSYRAITRKIVHIEAQDISLSSLSSFVSLMMVLVLSKAQAHHYFPTLFFKFISVFFFFFVITQSFKTLFYNLIEKYYYSSLHAH